MPRRMQSCLRLALLFTTLLVVHPPQLFAERFRRARATIHQAIDQGRAPSLAVAVVRGGEIVWEEAFGWADRERQIPATPHTMYSLASVSKPLTATGLMVLVERGLVELDHPINDYLGEARLRVRVGDRRGATVRQVADHTSGLPLHHRFFVVEAESGRLPSRIEAIRRHGNLVTEPGQRFQYSNLGYGVLDHLIERLSRQPFATFMQEAVFRPLGLDHTAVLEHPRGPSSVATRYSSAGRPLPFYLSDHGGGSALYSCVHDLALFAFFHLRNRRPDQKPIVSDRTLRSMQVASSRPPSRSGSYGIGWSIQSTRRGDALIRHDGGMPGASASLVLLPARKLAVTVVSNSRSQLPQRLSSEILSELRVRRARRTGASSTGSRRPPRPLLGTWSGHLDLGESHLPLTLHIESRKSLHAGLGTQPLARLQGVSYREGYLVAWMTGRPTAGAASIVQPVRLTLKLRGSQLGGVATTFSRSAEGLPAALSYWTELKLNDGRPRGKLLLPADSAAR